MSPTAEIYYKRSTDGGTTWAKTKRLTWNSEYSGDVSIAIDLNDNIHIVWCDYSYGGVQIFYKMSTDGGVSWSGAKSIRGTFSGSGDPNIAIDQNNHIHVSWGSVGSSMERIAYTKSTDGGVTWAETKELTWRDSDDPKIAVDANNNIHVVWEGNCSKYSSDTEIYHSVSTDGGTTWKTKRLCWTPGESRTPDIAVDSSNHLHVVWEDFHEIYYKKGIQ